MEDAGWGVELKFVVYKSNLKKSMAKNRCTLASEQTSPAYSEPHNSPTMLRSLLKPIPGLSGGKGSAMALQEDKRVHKSLRESGFVGA